MPRNIPAQNAPFIPFCTECWAREYSAQIRLQFTCTFKTQVNLLPEITFDTYIKTYINEILYNKYYAYGWHSFDYPKNILKDFFTDVWHKSPYYNTVFIG